MANISKLIFTAMLLIFSGEELTDAELFVRAHYPVAMRKESHS